MPRTAATIYILVVLLECASLLQASSGGSHNIKDLLEDHHKVRSEPEPSAANMEMLVSQTEMSKACMMHFC